MAKREGWIACNWLLGMGRRLVGGVVRNWGAVMGGVRGGEGVRWEGGGMGSWRLMGWWWVGRSGNVFSKVDGERGLKIHSHMVFWKDGLGKRKGSG